MFERLPILVLIPHADAGDRTKWTLDQDVRPLTELGRSQAAELATAVGVVDAVVSSPARRCVETVEPIAAASGVSIDLHDGLRELTFVTEHETWDAWSPHDTWRAQLHGAAGLGRVARVAAELERRFPPDGDRRPRVVLSAHGDLIPMFALFAAGYFGVPGPPPVARGGGFEIDARNSAEPIRSLGALADRKNA